SARPSEPDAHQVGTPDTRDTDHVQDVRLARRSGADVHAVQLMNHLRHRGPAADDQHRAARMLAQHAGRRGPCVASAEQLRRAAQALRQGRRGLLGAPVVARIDRLEPAGGTGVAEHLRQTLRALLALGRAARVSVEETTATIAVMLRVVPPPRALLVCQDAAVRQQLERRITPDMLDYESLADEHEGLRRFDGEFFPVVVTDSLQMVRQLRARTAVRTPFVLYVAELDDAAEREAGLAAGADDCLARRASERELDARLGAARRIAELES